MCLILAHQASGNNKLLAQREKFPFPTQPDCTFLSPTFSYDLFENVLVPLFYFQQIVLWDITNHSDRLRSHRQSHGQSKKNSMNTLVRKLAHEEI